MTTSQKFEKGYSPLWSPGDPVPADEKLSVEDQERLIAEMKIAGNFTDADEEEFRENAESAGPSEDDSE